MQHATFRTTQATMTDRDAPATRGTSFSQALGRTIRVLRTDQAMSRSALAEAAGISYSYLSAIENGSKPPSTKIQMVLADVLGLRHHELLAAAEARRERGEGIAAMVLGDDEAAGSPPAPRRQWRTVMPRARASLEDAAAMRSRSVAHRIAPDAADWATRSPLSPTSRDALLEMAELVADMTDDDIAFLLEMARRLAGR